MKPEDILLLFGLLLAFMAVGGYIADHYDERTDARRRNR